MTIEQKQIRDWMAGFGQLTPEIPFIPSLETRKLRARLIFEEVLETINALGILPIEESNGRGLLMNIGMWVFAENNDPNLLAIADGCEDLKVVTEGTLVACGLLKQNTHHGDSSACFFNDPLFDEVMRSNWSKMWKQKEVEDNNARLLTIGASVTKISPFVYLVKDQDGKVLKSPSYSPANLAPIIEGMKKDIVVN